MPVLPIVMPAVLTRAPDAVWISVLALLALQASFLVPPTGYAVMMARSAIAQSSTTKALTRALAPYLAAQLAVLALTLAWPALVYLGFALPLSIFFFRHDDGSWQVFPPEAVRMMMSPRRFAM